jgi:hypothetical protein
MSGLVGVQEVKRDKGGTEPTYNYTFFYGNGNANHYFGLGLFIHKGMSALKRAVFISDWMLCIILIGHLCDITVLNLHAPTKDKSVIQDSFNEELKDLEHVLNLSPK